MRALDVVALVFGVLLTGLAASALWIALAPTPPWVVLRTAAPVVLVAVGVLGLVLSRRT